MSHVDESLLVAYADDALDAAERVRVEAHLVSCPECRARVEEERAIAQRAAAVLGKGVPAAEPELAAFAEILRRSEQADTAQGGAGSPRARSWTLPPLAWAAMLVVGLGAAIIARTLLVSPGFNEPVQSRAQRGEMEASVPPRTPDAAVRADGSDTAGAVAETSAADTESVARPRAAQVAPSPAVPVPAPVVSDAMTTKSGAAPSAAAGQVERAPGMPPPPFEPSRERQRYADMLRRDTAAAADTQQQAAVVPDDRVMADTSADIALEAAVVVSQAMPGAAVIGGADVAWRGTAIDGVAARGESVAGVPAAPVTSVWLATGAAAWRARVVQQVDGISVEIIEWRTSPGTPGQRGILEDGRNYLFVQTDGVTFLLRAALPVDRLETLGRSIRRL